MGYLAKKKWDTEIIYMYIFFFWGGGELMGYGIFRMYVPLDAKKAYC